MTFDPQPANQLGWLLLLLLGTFFFFAGVSQSSQTAGETLPPAHHAPTDPGRPSSGGVLLPVNASLLTIEDVQIVTRETFPPQITVSVSGYWPDGCTTETQTIVKRDGGTISVRIFRILPDGAICTQQIVPYADDIAITTALMDGERFLSGDYVIDVNGTVVPARF